MNLLISGIHRRNDIVKSDIRVYRVDLRFPEMVQKYFAFLEARNFRCVKTLMTFVRFESPSLFVNVYHGRSSFEIGAELGIIGEHDKVGNYPYSLSALLEVARYPKAEEYRDFATHTPEGVNEGVKLVSRLFQDYVVPILNNPELFELLKEQRKVRTEKYFKKEKLYYLRRDLDKAWLAKDYPKVVEILSPVRKDLDLVQIKKLEYAEKHLV